MVNPESTIADSSIAESTTESAITFLSISKQYGVLWALHQLDLSVKEGECLALIGHNGAGKTTLLKLLLGLTRPTSGTIKLWGQASSEYAGGRRGYSIGFLPEAVVFKGNLNGIEILRFYARLKGVPVEDCGKILELVALEGVAGDRVSTYSKGMRQRLGLAQALLGEPRLLVLDEPTSGMDPFFRRKFFQIIRERQAMGSTVILSSHSLTEIEAQTDRIALLKQGRLVVQGSVQDLRQKADLPVRVGLTFNEQKVDNLVAMLSDNFEYRMPGANFCEVNCSNGEKMELLRKVCGQHHDLILDLEIRSPGLEELFVHFAGQEQDITACEART